MNGIKMSTLTRLILLALFVSTFGPQFSEALRCEIARTNCAFRDGCGFSLRSYMLECTSLIAGHTNQCSERCERALVALVSTEEGADLVNCDCEGNKFCIKSKERIEVCRSSVYSATAVDSIVSCNTARWICMADPVCSTALDYYQLFCRDLVHGKGCSLRCNNSLSILNRQEKAAKLRTCYCDGKEEFPCEKLKYNTEKFCYGRQPPFGIRLDDPKQRQRHHYGHEKDMQSNTIGYEYERYGRRHQQNANNNKRHRNRKFYEDFLKSSAQSAQLSLCTFAIALLSATVVNVLSS